MQSFNQFRHIDGSLYFISYNKLFHINLTLKSLDSEQSTNCPICELILEYLTYIGNVLSMIGLLMTAAIYIYDKIKYSSSIKILNTFYIFVFKLEK